jgi:hypothetical protein
MDGPSAPAAETAAGRLALQACERLREGQRRLSMQTSQTSQTALSTNHLLHFQEHAAQSPRTLPPFQYQGRTCLPLICAMQPPD